MADLHKPNTYKEVRSLSRGIKLIETLAELGWVKPGALSKYVEIDRSTVYRLIDTLIAADYVKRRDEDGAIALTPKLMHVASGIRNDDLIAQIVGPHMMALTEKIIWPSDFVTFAAGCLSIQYSTHNISQMSIHRAMVGKNRPLLRSALGKAFLSAMDKKQLKQTLDIVRTLGGDNAKDTPSPATLRRMIKDVQKKGYASAIGTTDAKISAIALPICTPKRAIGALNIIFFKKALAPQEAAENYLKSLSKCVADIELDLVKANYE